jgi:hypothetical protein
MLYGNDKLALNGSTVVFIALHFMNGSHTRAILICIWLTLSYLAAVEQPVISICVCKPDVTMLSITCKRGADKHCALRTIALS